MTINLIARNIERNEFAEQQHNDLVVAIESTAIGKRSRREQLRRPGPANLPQHDISIAADIPPGIGQPWWTSQWWQWKRRQWQWRPQFADFVFEYHLQRLFVQCAQRLARAQRHERSSRLRDQYPPQSIRLLLLLLLCYVLGLLQSHCLLLDA